MTERLLVTGCRTWANRKIVEDALAGFDEPITVIEGEAPGLDSMARDIALALGHTVEPYPAYWGCKQYEDHMGESCRLPDGRHNAVHGKAAGAIRNTRMLKDGKPTLIYAFHDDLPGSKGTANMVQQARKAAVPIRHFSREKSAGIFI